MIINIVSLNTHCIETSKRPLRTIERLRLGRGLAVYLLCQVVGLNVLLALKVKYIDIVIREVKRLPPVKGTYATFSGSLSESELCAVCA